MIKQFTCLLIFAFLCISPVTKGNAGDNYPNELTFKENKNQWYKTVKFMGEIPGGKIFLENQGFTYLLMNGNDIEKMHPYKGPVTVHGHVYKVDFVGSNPHPVFTQEDKSETYYNYFIGNDPSRWASDVHSYGQVTYHDLYPNIDMKVYGKDYTLKYDLLIHSGGDASAVQFRYRGSDDIFLRNGNLVIQTSVGTVVELAPYAFQYLNGEKKEVACDYVLNNGILSFAFPNGFNESETLVIDPTLIFSTYTGSTADNWGWTATYDDQGNMYLGGYVNELDFLNQKTGVYPTTTGAFQVTWKGGTGGGTGQNGNGIEYACDMGISKLNSTGTTMIYSTYLGGRDNECPHSLFVNAAGELCVYGETYSDDFPVTATAYDKTYNGDADICVTVFNTTGTALVGSTYIGGSGQDGINFDASEFGFGNLKVNYGDGARGEIICDNLNNIYIASSSSSDNFPVSSGCFQNTKRGAQDGCIFKMNRTCSALIYSTYLGGTNDDAAYSLDLKSDYGIYVTGGTMSSNFPSTPNSVNPTYRGGLYDGFLAHLNASGTALISSTFVGTNKEDQSYNVKIDGGENVYIVGNTNGNYPVTPGVYTNPNSGQFITKFDSSLSNIIYSTVFGNGNGQPNISPTAFLVDTCENVYVCGWGTNSSLFVHTTNMFNLPLTTDAYQDSTDGTDFYIIVLSRNAQSLIYGTYFGGNGTQEHVDGGTSRFDKNGVIYEAVCAGCGGRGKQFPVTDGGTPTTAGVWSTTNKSPNCNELGFKMEISLFKVKAITSSLTGCIPFEANFSNKSLNATSYYWDFGTGNITDSSHAFQPTFNYTDTGTYKVRLIASNPVACVSIDTAFILVRVRNDTIKTSLNSVVHDYCDSVVVDFTSQSNRVKTSFAWNFDDGTTSTLQNPTHIFKDGGTYNVTLIASDSLTCNESDSASVKIVVIQNTSARIDKDSIKGCVPLNINFNNQSKNATSYFWNFGTGNLADTSNLFQPTFNFVTPGKYSVMLVAFNPTSCNVADTAHINIIVRDTSITADILSTIIDDCDSVTVKLIGVSSNPDSKFHWDFNDGTFSSLANPTHIYRIGGTYNIILTVTDSTGCSAHNTARKQIVVSPFTVAGLPASATGCVPLQVNFQNQSSQATKYFWNFGTGNSADTSDLMQPAFTFGDTGTYIVTLIASNPLSCNGSDTAYMPVKVVNTFVSATLNKTIVDLCDSVVVDFSGASSGSSSSYYWDFNDGSVASIKNPSHTFHNPGSYVVKLIVTDNSVCNPYDTAVTVITVQEQVRAEISSPAVSECAPVTISFKSQVENASEIFWDFGDGSTSSAASPTHTYTSPGKFKVSLAGVNPALCNYSDSAFITINILPAKPDANFIANPDSLAFGEVVTFTNYTTGGTDFLWHFGDGSTSLDFNTTHIYQKSGIYLVCLEVNYKYQCPDSICALLRVETPVAIDVPNAFTPNGDHHNDILYVRGAHYDRILFRVFNRWGEKVFETNDMKIGWDGTYKGKPQEMDSFAWELFATLDDGREVFKKGNVTLIR